jgi:hypothetical protein
MRLILGKETINNVRKMVKKGYKYVEKNALAENSV